MNEINITVAAREDASTAIEEVGASAQRTERVVVQSMASTEQAFDTAARSTGRLGDALDKTAGFGTGMADGLGGAGDVAQSVGDIMSYSERQAEELARAQNDVEQAAQDAAQAMQDLEQANRDLAQAEIDATQATQDKKQALLDQEVAQKAYNEAVKEHGKNSAEAKQAQLDLSQAQIDAKQATEDAKQAQQDMVQAELDAAQAAIDQKVAVNDLTTAQRELGQQGTVLKQVAEWGGMLSAVVGGLVGVIGAVTAVQWAWNAALAANPIGLVIAIIVVLIGVIVLIATKTTWFQDLWNAIWGAIGDRVKSAGELIKRSVRSAIDFAISYFKFMWSIPGRIKNAFASVGSFIFAPFRWAFNNIAWAWNRTVGNIRFSVPGWVPGIGGNSFSVPKIPSLDIGGDVLRTGLALIHRGERILPAAQTRRLDRQTMQGPHAEERAIRLILEVVQNRRGTGRDLEDLIIERLGFRIRTEAGGDVNEYFTFNAL